MGDGMQLRDRIGRRMKLQDLHVFMTVVQEGGMGKAARRLHTSQPAISRSIAELEQAFGVRLLDRTPQGVEPTAHGRVLLEGGAAVFDDLSQAVKHIQFLADTSAGEVRIGSTPFTAASFITTVVDRMSRRHPRMVFHLVTGSTEALLRELGERKVDLMMIRRFGPLDEERMHFESLFEDSFVVAAGAHSSWVRRRRIELAELVDEAWVLPPPESVISSIAMKAFRASGLGYPRATVVTLNPEVRASLLATGRYLTIFPSSLLKFPGSRPELRVLPVALPMSPVPSGIVTLKHRKLSPVAGLFIECAREVAKNVVKGARGRAPRDRT